MTRQHFSHRGFTIQVIAHETFPANAPALPGGNWYACSAVISRGAQAAHLDREKFLHPDRVFVTQQHALDYGLGFARHAIDDEILYDDLSRFMSARPI